MSLTPPDLARCQAEIRERAPFALGGTHRVTRCAAAPTTIATEARPGPDGLRGAMSLCDACKTELIKQLGPVGALFAPIPPEEMPT